jgi:hypothetical protein
LKDPATVSMMKVEGVEIRVAGEPLEVVNEQTAALVVDQSGLTQLLRSTSPAALERLKISQNKWAIARSAASLELRVSHSR